MGTHPIFGSDFVWLTEFLKRKTRNRQMRVVGYFVAMMMMVGCVWALEKRSLGLVDIRHNKHKGSWMLNMINSVLTKIDEFDKAPVKRSVDFGYADESQSYY